MPSAAATSATIGSRPERGGQVAAGPDHPVDLLDHVHRDADGAGLVGHGAGDGLADPPGGVGGELVALGVVELLDGADEAEVAFLDEVEEGHAAAGVALGDAHHEAQVRLEQVVLGGAALATMVRRSAPQLRRRARRRSPRRAQALLGEQAGLDALGQVDLLLGGEQLGPADAVEVGPDQVGRDAALVLDGLRVLLVEVRLRRLVGVEVNIDVASSSTTAVVVLVRAVLVLATVCRLPVSLAGVEPALVTRRSFLGAALSLGEASGQTAGSDISCAIATRLSAKDDHGANSDLGYSSADDSRPCGGRRSRSRPACGPGTGRSRPWRPGRAAPRRTPSTSGSATSAGRPRSSSAGGPCGRRRRG